MTQMTLCLILFILTLIGFAVGSSYVSITVISLISMMVMVLTGCLEPATALAGFSNGSAILMASMFIVAAGLNRTQMVNKISGYICRVSKGSFTKVLAGYVLLTCILSQFIPSAVVCFCIVFPMAQAACREMNVNPSKMMFSLGITAIGDAFTTRRIPADGYPGLEELREVIGRHDVKFSNLEMTYHHLEGTPAAVSGGTWAMAEPRCLDDMKRYGFNLFTTANNHTGDYGEGGVLATIRHLRERDMVFSGTGANLAEASGYHQQLLYRRH
ncbi:MAG: hypothetical protein HFF73_06555 [Oscillospiraceae bacterium]|nr:hypothetical protein [Oscillospiraceae bacterium]